MSSLSLRHLRAFVAVAEAGHFGRASAQLGIAQPLLSQMILRLEQKLGGALLLRRPVVRVTPTGKAFLPYAKRALEEIHTGAAAALQSSAGAQGSLKLGFPTLLSLSWLPEAIADYHRAVPSVQISYSDLTTSEQLQAFRAGEIDVGFIRQDHDHGGELSVLPIDTEPLILVMSSSHPFAARQSIEVTNLADEPFILFPRSSAPRLFDTIVSQARQGGLELNLSREGRDWLTAVGLVRAGAGLSFIPASLAAIGLPGLSYRRVPGISIETTLSAAWPRATDNPVIAPFIGRLKAFAQGRRGGSPG